MSPLVLLEGTCWSMRPWRGMAGWPEERNSETMPVTIISCIVSMSSDCYLTLQIITSPFTATSTLLMERSLAQL